ncbi:VENN motif pre-toxin domain-containing protein [Dryocola boscaweniae]|uniref:VENN motif pre-toxin domain-containing protein n=1 Tax=Dryocola boscaweniae TaxID=2925397 RepID=UPI0022F07500|nr:VENN motif pre-toxin domain-containing protein [Dryocola boscaweniae]
MANAANALTGMSGSQGHAEGTTSSAISGGSIIIRDKNKQKQDVADLSRDVENANGSIAPIFDKEKEQQRLKEAQVISQISGQISNIVMTLGETEAMKAAREKPENTGKTDAELRQTEAYKTVMKGYGTGSTPQMVVQAITGVLGGLNADNFGQALAGGLNPAVAQLIKQTTGDDDKANLMAHAVWGALAAQLGGNSAAAGAAGAFSGEAAAQYIINNYYGGKTDNLSEQERRQISTLATIAAGIAGGLSGNSTEAAGAGAVAGKNAVENNALSDKPKKPPINIIDINPMMKVGGVDADGEVNPNGMSKASIPKVPPKLQALTNPAQGPVIPQGWVSKPGRTPGSTIYYPPNTDPGSPGSTYIRVMPPGSTPVPGLENGYWISIKNGQPINPATGGTGTRGETHVPLPTDTMPPKR